MREEISNCIDWQFYILDEPQYFVNALCNIPDTLLRIMPSGNECNVTQLDYLFNERSNCCRFHWLFV